MGKGFAMSGVRSSTLRALAIAAVICCAGTVPAMAQDGATPAPAASDNAEIVVTARRRDENLLTTPVSATVRSEDCAEYRHSSQHWTLNPTRLSCDSRQSICSTMAWTSKRADVRP